MSLIEQLQHENHCIYMDNLYLSAKLCLVTWKYHKAMIHGVCRQGGRGIPEKMKQQAFTKQDEEFAARNTLYAAICDGDPEMTPKICTSLYDVKPFYMLSTVADEIVWNRKIMNILCQEKRRKVKVPFYRLNLADICITWRWAKLMLVTSCATIIDLTIGCESVSGGGVSGCGVWVCC